MSGAVDVGRYTPRFSVLVDGRELPVEAAHMVKGVEVVHELNRASAFAVEVQDQYVDGRLRWLDGGRGARKLFDIGNHVAIAFGYAGPLETVCDGVVQRIAASFSEGLAPSFTVGGSDTAFDAMNEPRSSETFRDLSDSGGHVPPTALGKKPNRSPRSGTIEAIRASAGPPAPWRTSASRAAKLSRSSGC